MVETRSGKETSPYTTEQQEKMAALVRENKERKEREKQAKLKATADEQAAKMKRLEEEMKRVQQEEERRKAAEAEAAAEEEKERMRIESGEGSSGGTMKWETDTELEKKISEWIANLSLGEDEEAESYATKDEKAALAAELAAMTDPMERREGRRAKRPYADKSQQAGITFDQLSREVVLYESKSMPVTTFWHKDLEKGKKWKNRTISGHVKAKDHMILTLEKGGTDEVPYDQIEWGLENDGSSVGQGRSFAAVAAGGRPQGGGGQGQRAQAMGGRGPGAQGVGEQGNRQAGVYLDDILVFSKTLQEHQGHLRQVLEKLREANFKINKKCMWAKTQVLYLGHVLEDGIKPEDNKITVIDWSMPRTLTELRSFLGLANYYRKLVRNFSTIVAPLRSLLKKEAIWQWDKDCTSALKKLKRALIEYPVLKVADPSLPFVVTTDASQYGIGAVLQQDDSNSYRPVEFMSARMP
ncbi:hypothetical protein CBR_g53712 [Chara braunii]|uniref:Reverse transcriptase/retrotransposon-derived protein RNase H-like domain-containing protein n=1 Tax=Chara braunii TaxID=69332 RepID=A0A388MB62_CHABU|nr:hypothetical protein CBR_g53712 [Chara braunii]|eukprot:GBG91821.1 hypothetical protein CBR_g53712 [Chara braunii]